MDLLAWTVEIEKRLARHVPVDMSWPIGLPRRVAGAGKDTLQNAADELFLCSVAGILHHEVGHIERGHDPRRLPKPTPGLASKDDPQVAEADAIWLSWEKEADAWSADWLLQGLDETDDRFLKRVIGIALGFLGRQAGTFIRGVG